jgi:hypothetical protein
MLEGSILLRSLTNGGGTSTQNIQHMLHHLQFKLNMILLSLAKVTLIRTDLNCAKHMYNKSETVIKNPFLSPSFPVNKKLFDLLFGVWCSTSDYKALEERYIWDNQQVKQPISEMCSSH